MPAPLPRLIWALPAAGLAAGSAVWLAANAAAPQPPVLADVTTRLTQSATMSKRAGALGPSTTSYVTTLLAHPVLQVAAGEGGADPKLQLEGIALTSSRRAALLAIGSAPAVWLQLDESRAGVTLRRVERQTVVVESLSGEHSLTLGAQPPSPVLASASPLGTASGTQIQSTK